MNLFPAVIPLQQEVDDILIIVSRQFGKRRFEFKAIPNYAAVNFLRLRHAAVSNHLVEFGYAHANISGRFFA